MMGKRKGMSAVDGMIGLMVVLLVGVTAVLPTIQTAITNANFTGTVKTIMDNIPLFIAIGFLLLVVGIWRTR